MLDEMLQNDIIGAADCAYLWLAANYDGQTSDEYKLLCELTKPGLYKPSCILSEDSLDDIQKELYSELDLDKCIKIVDACEKYTPQD